MKKRRRRAPGTRTTFVPRRRRRSTRMICSGGLTRAKAKREAAWWRSGPDKKIRARIRRKGGAWEVCHWITRKRRRR